MQTTIDKAGRVVIPKRLRDRLGLQNGATITIDDAGDHVEIRPANVITPRLTEQDGLMTFIAGAEAPPLTDEDVRQLVEENRR
ncbi:MAG: AbrB/MazE/SpoVT family DNA-binding domain-containing protein [Mycobacteriales bacterium]